MNFVDVYSYLWNIIINESFIYNYCYLYSFVFLRFLIYIHVNMLK
jgi:hypothetical protein